MDKECIGTISAKNFTDRPITVAEVLSYFTLERLHELEQADKEGRLLVLPCSIESPIYLIHLEESQKRKPKSYRVDKCEIDHFIIGGSMIPMITAVSKDNEWHELIDGTQEGSEYWFTREAAEAALAKDNNVPTKEEENHEPF